MRIAATQRTPPWIRCLVVALLACAGCGPRVAPVTGTLKINGNPAADIEVYFVPDGEMGTKGARAAAVTDAAGHFEMDLGPTGKGALVGHHRVVLIDRLALPPVPDDRVDKEGSLPRIPRPSRVPEKYNSALNTPLRAEVEAATKNIELEVNTQKEVRKKTES